MYSDSIQISVQQHNFNETILSKSSMNHSKPIRVQHTAGQLNIGFLWQRINNIKFVEPKIGFTDIPQHVCTKMTILDNLGQSWTILFGSIIQHHVRSTIFRVIFAIPVRTSRMTLSLTLPTRNPMSATCTQEYCWNDVTWRWTDVVGMTGFNEKHLWSGKIIISEKV